ncbi:hypothetical protein [Ensifer sp.]|jgi:hypothetical protein|uniref:hypothetical protein n=1 Tax=Ensifer sp. TaxID=1872086 RepID=UPI002E0DD287|nr:hypothetical protein [Ensifer sp.]
MFSRGGSDAKGSRRKRPQPRETIDTLIARAKGNPAKALVLTCIGQLAIAGLVELRMRENGEAEARFTSGEIYLLAETTVIRLA